MGLLCEVAEALSLLACRLAYAAGAQDVSQVPQHFAVGSDSGVCMRAAWSTNSFLWVHSSFKWTADPLARQLGAGQWI